MFTGIIEEIGTIKSINHENSGKRITVEAKKIMADISDGESIAIDGVCLTVENFGKDFFVVYVMPESIKRTSLVNIKVGQKVNLEKALLLNSRLGGHFVLGHVDTTGTITQTTSSAKAKIYKIEIPGEYANYLISKGSISVDGISLTIVDIGKDYFSVSIIPHTQKLTTLGNKKNNDKVNIEIDILSKHVVDLITKLTGSKLTKDKLKKFGIIKE